MGLNTEQLSNIFIKLATYHEEKMELKDRITVNPKIMDGVPCVRNLRMPVATVLALLAEGFETKEIIEQHDELEPDDIKAVLKYASEYFRTREFPLAG